MTEVAILLSHERSGSTLFQDLLSRHPDVALHGDVFNYLANLEDPNSFYEFRKARAISRPNSLNPVAEEIYGLLDDFFKTLIRRFDETALQLVDIKYGHVAALGGFWFSPGFGSVFLQYVKNRKIKLVHLKRRDLFSAVASGHLAARTGVWNTRSKSELKELKVRIKPETFNLQLEELIHCARVYTYYTDLLGGMNISYEDFALSQSGYTSFFRTVELFLGLKPFSEYRTKLLKVSPDPSTFVENYSDLAAFRTICS